MLFYHQQAGEITGPLPPADLNTRTGGHYVINASGTGYDWVPDTTTNANPTPAVPESPGGGQDRKVDTSPSGGGYNTNTPQNLMNGPLGYLVGKVADVFTTPKTADEIKNTPVVDVAPKGVPSDIDPATGLQGQGTIGPTGLYGDAAAGTGITGVDPNAGEGGVGGFGGGATSASTGIAGLGQQARDAEASSERSETEAQGVSGSSFGGNRASTGIAGLLGAFTDPAQAAGQTTEAGRLTDVAATNPMGVDPAQAAQAEAAAQAAREASTSVATPSGVNAPASVDAPAPSDPDPGDAKGGFYHKGKLNYQLAQGGIASLAQGGLGPLGGYSDGGQLLRGPGDGVSDSIPATIGQGRQPARLADGEFVVPARIVSELGNGSTEAGAKQLYAMLARIQAGRKKSIGKDNVAKNSNAARHLPA
jgi:hypothetical protein